MAKPWWGAQEKDSNYRYEKIWCVWFILKNKGRMSGKETVLLKHVYKEEWIKDVAFKANCRAMQHTHLNQSQFFP